MFLLFGLAYIIKVFYWEILTILGALSILGLYDGGVGIEPKSSLMVDKHIAAELHSTPNFFSFQHDFRVFALAVNH